MTAIEKCRYLAGFSEQPGVITRTFLSAPMHGVHRTLTEWMEPLGMRVWVDDAGNLHGHYPGIDEDAPRLLIGSHVDTVPKAGAFDGVLGVVLGIQLIEALIGHKMTFGIEVVAFSEEEGVRFGVPFLGSRALVGTLTAELLATQDKQGITVAQAIRDFGLQPENIRRAVVHSDKVLGYLEFHIEQGPILESRNVGLGLVTAIVGQSRYEVTFRGQANHSGTTPMNLRRDALAAAAEWIVKVEEVAKGQLDLVATVGRLEVLPGAGNVIAGEVRARLDVRHPDDSMRLHMAEIFLEAAQGIGKNRNIGVDFVTLMDAHSVACDTDLRNALKRALTTSGYEFHSMTSGAGHDAMVMEQSVPVAMLFLRSPGGISHHPNETVLEEDVHAAVQVGLAFLEQLEMSHG